MTGGPYPKDEVSNDVHAERGMEAETGIEPIFKDLQSSA